MGALPSRGRGPGCFHWWSLPSAAGCRPLCNSTAGLRHTGGWERAWVRGEDGSGGGKRPGPRLGSCPQPRPEPCLPSRGSPGLHGAYTVHSPWVVGAHAAMLHIAAIVRLQSGRLLSPVPVSGAAIPSLGASASGALVSQGPLSASPSAVLGGAAVRSWPHLLPPRCLGPDWGGWLTWKRPESARAWARVQGQSGRSSRKFGSWSSSSTQARH